MFTVYGMSLSGNCHKVRMALEHLRLPYRWKEVDIMAGATHSDAFLAINPNGKVPVLELDDGQALAESNAILYYLAEDTPLLPRDRLRRARVLSWLFFEQYSHEPYLAVARFICRFLPPDHPRRTQLPELRQRGQQALAVMEQHLQQQLFFGSDQYSIADIALFAYTSPATEAGFQLNDYPAVESWLGRVKQQAQFVAMQEAP